jgi:hypothetical protein
MGAKDTSTLPFPQWGIFVSGGATEQQAQASATADAKFIVAIVAHAIASSSALLNCQTAINVDSHQCRHHGITPKHFNHSNKI